MNRIEEFKKADEYYKKYGKHTTDRIKYFLKEVGDTPENRKKYSNLVHNMNMKRYLKNAPEEVKKKVVACQLRYQKSDKYKAYRRKYEKGYRAEHRTEHNFKSWKSMRKSIGKPTTKSEELKYLMTRS